jgi:hypothetical protein
MKFDPDYWLWKNFSKEWDIFSQNNLDGAWYFRYLAAALAFVAAYFFFDVTNQEKYSHGIKFAIFVAFSSIFALYAFVMMKEVAKVSFWCACAYVAYLALESAGAIGICILIGAYWIASAIKNR